ncbi:potassium channel family protein [Trichothermofontia sp.]
MPNSFAINNEITNREEIFQSLFYYSFVTLATIGYGDIIPVTPLARTLSITLGIAGQMYLTILIAILVSKYLNTNDHDGA